MYTHTRLLPKPKTTALNVPYLSRQCCAQSAVAACTLAERRKTAERAISRMVMVGWNRQGFRLAMAGTLPISSAHGGGMPQESLGLSTHDRLCSTAPCARRVSLQWAYCQAVPSKRDFRVRVSRSVLLQTEALEKRRDEPIHTENFNDALTRSCTRLSRRIR